MDEKQRLKLLKTLEKAKTPREEALLLVMAMDPKDVDDAFLFLRALVLKKGTK